jgi:tetratricopeptide (TPR) repeat protein
LALSVRLPMNDNDRKHFNRLYERLEAHAEAQTLQEFADFAKALEDPWDQAELIYHQVLFLLDMDNPTEARQRIEDLKRSVSALTEPPADSYEVDVTTSLPVMSRYAEARVAFHEGKQETLQLVLDLESTYPKQLSTAEFATIRDVLQTMRGHLLAGSGKWLEARPVLEGAYPPEAWKGVHCCYLGQCYFEVREYQRAKDKLEEALSLSLMASWDGRARYILGIVEYRLGDKRSAKKQFEAAVQIADPEYLQKTNIWEWLETTCRDLGLHVDAENYRIQGTIHSVSKFKVN